MHVSYLRNLTPAKFNQTVDELTYLIKFRFPTCNFLLARGLSGTMIVPALAAKMGLQWGIARKGKSHSSYKVEVSAYPPAVNAVFVDDLIDSGASFRAALSALKRTMKKHNEYSGDVPVNLVCLGAACYAFECNKLDKYPVYYTNGD